MVQSLQKTVVKTGLLSRRTLIEAIFGQHGGDIIHMQAVTHAGIIVVGLNRRDIAVAIVVARRRAMKHAEGDHFPAFELDDLVAILGLSAISVMHFSFSS